MNRMIKRMVIPVGAAIALGSSGFAFMASNSVPLSRAGDGTGVISGYNVSNIHYTTLGDWQPGNGNNHISAVSFALDHAATPSNVRALVSDVNGGHVYYKCSESANLWTCNFTGGQNSMAQMGTATKLEVTAAQ